jgi:hypothetical protein
MVRNTKTSKNSSVGDNMVSAETMGNANSSIDNVIEEVVGATKARRGRPSRKEVDSAALRTKSVVLPPETINDKASRSSSAPGGVKANGKNSVPAKKIMDTVVISEDTAKNTTVDEASESENDEVRSLESQIRAQRRALLEYEFKKVKARLEELQKQMAPATNALMTTDDNSNSDLEEIPNIEYISPGAFGKGKKTLFSITARNKEERLSCNEYNDDARQFERPMSYFKPLEPVRRPFYPKTDYGLQGACSSQSKARPFYRNEAHDLDDDEYKDHGVSYDNRINESIKRRRRSEDEEEDDRFQSNSYSDRYRPSNQNKFKNDEKHRIQSGYRMKCPKFCGGEEDYDVWYLNMQAFFRLDDYTESEKIRIMLAQLGGEARSFIGHQDDTKFKTVAKLHSVLKEAFSEQLNKTETLMTCKQKAGERIRSYGLRLRCLASKCGYEGEESDEWCLTVLKQNSLPFFANLLKNCMPDVTFPKALKYLAINERSQAHTSKRRYDTIDQIEESDDDESSDEESTSKNKRAKSCEVMMALTKQQQDYKNCNKQVRDRIKTMASQISVINKKQDIADQLNVIGQQSHTSTNQGSNRVGRSLVCFHCAKSGHRFNDCQTCSDQDREKIITLLRAKKFDYQKLKERAERLNSNISNKSSLNSSAPKSSCQ